jgi:hypothetical protein
VTEEAFMKTVIAAALAAVTLGGCIAVPVYGPPRAYVAPPPAAYYYGPPHRHHYRYYR